MKKEQNTIDKIIDIYKASLNTDNPITIDRLYDVLHSLRFIDIRLNSSIERTLTIRELMPIFSTAIYKIRYDNDSPKDIEDIE